MKIRLSLVLTVLLSAFVCSEVQRAASSAGARNQSDGFATFTKSASGNLPKGCPYAESREYKEEWGKGVISYYWKCKQSFGDPEWNMYMKHNGYNNKLKVSYIRTTETKYSPARDSKTYCYATPEYTMVDGGNTSTEEPKIKILEVKELKKEN